MHFIGGARESHDDLDREPGVADRLDVEERIVWIRLRFGQHPFVDNRAVRQAAVYGAVLDERHSHVRMRFQAERQDAHADEEHR